MSTGICKNHKAMLKCKWCVRDNFTRALIRLLVLPFLGKPCSSHMAKQSADVPVLLLVAHWNCLVPKSHSLGCFPIWLYCVANVDYLSAVSRPATEASYGSLLEGQNLSPTADLLNPNLPFYKVSRGSVCTLVENHIGWALLPQTCYSWESPHQTYSIRISKDGTWTLLFVINFLGG